VMFTGTDTVVPGVPLVGPTDTEGSAKPISPRRIAQIPTTQTAWQVAFMTAP
jgi:hypothetical protein